MKIELNEKVVIVTGSSSGIGRAIARQFGSEGARVVVTYHSDKKGAGETATGITELGGEAMTVRYDLTDDESIEAALEHVGTEWGGVDILVNNAVVWAQTPPGEAPRFEHLDPVDWRHLIRGNLEGVFLTTQRVVPYMKARGGGRIVNISSTIAQDGLPGSAPYASAKAGILGLTTTLAAELGPDGILTNAVLPGITLTERGQAAIPSSVQESVAAETPTNRLTSPEEVADLVVFLASERNGHINGESIRVTGGL